MPTFIDPADLHDPTAFGYRHTVAIPASAELVLVSGQYASGPDGAVVSDDFAEQVDRALRSVEVAVGAHGLDLRDVVQLRTYVVGLDLERLGALGRAVHERWGTEPPTQTVLGVAGLALPDIAVEIEAVAVRPAG
jgi:enamine deaminase RidA (YjgF/YER057c/UK114 family)